jgi:hypothetical protein
MLADACIEAAAGCNVHSPQQVAPLHLHEVIYRCWSDANHDGGLLQKPKSGNLQSAAVIYVTAVKRHQLSQGAGRRQNVRNAS